MSSTGSPFVPSNAEPSALAEPAFWFVFQRGKILAAAGNGRATVPQCRDAADLGFAPLRTHYLGLLQGRHCFACQIADDAPAVPGMRPVALRAALLGEMDETVATVAGRAFQIVEWDRTHQYCGACGGRTGLEQLERARRCPQCELLFFPRVAPVVMVLVTRGRQLALTRKAGYPQGRYTVVAGFVEAGETLEEAIARETREEIGVEVSGIRYFSSQPWPFPHSLVVAFNAEYAGGTLTADGVELEDARWFDVDALPELPEPVHVSRRLIDATVARLRSGEQ
jgi:NAD+ diphosphatase